MAHHTAYHFIRLGEARENTSDCPRWRTSNWHDDMMFEQDAQGQIDQSGESLHDGSQRSRPCQKPLFLPRLPVPPPKIEWNWWMSPQNGHFKRNRVCLPNIPCSGVFTLSFSGLVYWIPKSSTSISKSWLVQHPPYDHLQWLVCSWVSGRMPGWHIWVAQKVGRKWSYSIFFPIIMEVHGYGRKSTWFGLGIYWTLIPTKGWPNILGIIPIRPVKNNTPLKACNPLASWERRGINSHVYFVEKLQYSKIDRLLGVLRNSCLRETPCCLVAEHDLSRKRMWYFSPFLCWEFGCLFGWLWHQPNPWIL